jgi:dihydrolipoamide dehydrogenase
MLKAKDTSVKGLTSGVEYLIKKKGLSISKEHPRLKMNSNWMLSYWVLVTILSRERISLLQLGVKLRHFQDCHFDKNRVVSSTGALELKQVPKSLIVVGGGVIGLELVLFLV